MVVLACVPRSTSCATTTSRLASRAVEESRSTHDVDYRSMLECDSVKGLYRNTPSLELRPRADKDPNDVCDPGGLGLKRHKLPHGEHRLYY